MDAYLLTARSITHAQQMLRVLERSGIRTKVQRVGPELSERGCGYSLEVSEKSYPRAITSLSRAQQMPLRIFRRRGRELEEVRSL